MTSDEIKVAEPYAKDKEMFWLREIAYQLAVMNERNADLDKTILTNQALTDDWAKTQASKMISDSKGNI